MKTTVYRHGQSTANAGEASDDPATIPLTDLGRAQAVMIAEATSAPPSLVVTSPFIRTKQTAEPTLARWPESPQEEWPIQEFTYLPPEPYRGTTAADRHEFAAAFWDRGDPFHREGSDAESLNDLFGRAHDMITRLGQLPVDADVLVFGHGMFMRAVLWGAITSVWTMTPETMRSFRSFCFSLPFPNAVSMPLFNENGSWLIGTLGIGHIPKRMTSI